MLDCEFYKYFKQHVKSREIFSYILREQISDRVIDYYVILIKNILEYNNYENIKHCSRKCARGIYKLFICTKNNKDYKIILNIFDRFYDYSYLERQLLNHKRIVLFSPVGTSWIEMKNISIEIFHKWTRSNKFQNYMFQKYSTLIFLCVNYINNYIIFFEDENLSSLNRDIRKMLNMKKDI